MAEQVSDKLWSNFKPGDYTDQQWLRACLLVRPGGGPAKVRGSLPVREPDGTLNKNGVAAASAVLSSVGGSGAARGNKLIASKEEVAAATKKLVAIYKNALQKEPPAGLMHSGLDAFLSSQGVISHDQSTAGDTAPNSGPNTGACLVALPRSTDPIRLVGDEDKHATLLFLGETSSLPSDAKTVILETLQNVSLLFTPFSEQIVDIQRLGSDNPPALVALLTSNNLTNLRQALLINPKLGEYLQNTTQYPSYTPHVTLAYPDYQGEAELRKTVGELFRIRFDRLALWWGDEHIEFSLDMTDIADMPMAQVEQLESWLAHHGVKGQKWGVRRSTSALDSAAGRKPDAVPKGTDVRSRIAMKLSKPGSVIARADGKVFIKKKDGSWGETKLSSEAENLVKTRQTHAHELSNKELNDALARARLIEDYNKFFNDPNGREMKMTVERLQTQKNYNQLRSELHPSTRKQAVKLIASAGTAYVAFKKIDKASDGALSKGLVKAFTANAAKDVAKKAVEGAAKAAV